MAGKKVRNEIDGIRAELRTLSEAVWALRDKVTFHNAAAAATATSNRPKRPSAPGDPETRPDGVVISRGSVVNEATGQECRWDFEGAFDDVMAIDDERTARSLAAIGHRQRLAILKQLLASPSTVTELVAALELGTTGAAYHHLNVLQAADLVTQAARGVFSVPPQRAAALVAILAGMQAADGATVVDVASAGPDAASETSTDEATGKGKKRKAA